MFVRVQAVWRKVSLGNARLCNFMHSSAESYNEERSPRVFATDKTRRIQHPRESSLPVRARTAPSSPPQADPRRPPCLPRPGKLSRVTLDGSVHSRSPVRSAGAIASDVAMFCSKQHVNAYVQQVKDCRGRQTKKLKALPCYNTQEDRYPQKRV